MIRDATLHVLAEAAEIGLPEAATVPAASFDPLLRPFIKKRVRHAVDDATARARKNAPGDHVLRLAFLASLPEPPDAIDPNDDRAVEKIFDTLAEKYLPPREPKDHREGGAYRAGPTPVRPLADSLTKRPKRKWPVTTPASLGFLGVAVVVAGIFVVPFFIPSAMERFQKTPLGDALGEPLTEIVVQGSRGASPATRAKLLSPEVQKQIGKDATSDLERIVDLVPDVETSPAESTDEAMAPLFAAVNAFDQKVTKAKLPVLLHAYAQGRASARSVWITSWFVENRDEIAIDGQPIRFVFGRRLDELNLAAGTLYKATAEDWAILALDNVEENFVETLLTPVAKGTPMGTDVDDPKDTSPRAELARTAGHVLAAEIMKATHLAASDADDLRQAIAERNDNAGLLAHAGYSVKASSAIAVSSRTTAALEKTKDHADPAVRILIDRYIQANARAARDRKHVADAVDVIARLEEAEFAGRLDAEKRLANEHFPKLGRADAYVRSRANASSELALLSRPDTSTALEMWRISRALLSADDDGDENAAFAVLFAVFKQLGISNAEDVGDEFIVNLKTAIEMPKERVHAAATAAYVDLFGHAPPTLVRRKL